MTTPDATVLVVEDEDSFVEALTVGLKREGFRVQVASDGAEALDMFDAIRPDLVLLDVMLPKISGIDVCREIRRRSSVPIIMVTAKGGEIDTVVGLEVGADDYVTKPYRLRELVARMRAVLRRRANESGAHELSGEALEVGDVALDPERHEVIIRGETVALPLKEFELLELLLANAGRVLPRETLIDRVWGTDYVGDTKTLDVHVKRLRAKVEPDPSTPTRIVTIRGLGYKYDVPRELTSGADVAGEEARTMASMSTPAGWEPYRSPKVRAGADAFHLSPFARLARTHVLVAASDALVTIALANSLFFDLDPNDARWKVFLYLALTMAPLALVAPFIGPVLDRAVGGRRWMLIGVTAGRALVCFIMIDDLQSLLLFPEAFAVLAMGKAYAVSRSAIVPTVVRHDSELVEANSKLQLLSGLAVPLAAVPAAIAYAIGGSEAILVVAVVTYLMATLAALRIPATQIAAEPATAAESAELHGRGIRLAASAMGLVRGIVGFLTFLILFDLRDDPTWKMGIVLILTGGGALVGSAVAPALRRGFVEERMLTLALSVAVVGGLTAAWIGDLEGSVLLAATVAIVSTSGKLAFDSLVQRDAPDANRGRSFASFELRFQIVWVVGAVIPVLITIPLTIGFLAIAAVAGFALFTYVAGQRATSRQVPLDESPSPDPTAIIDSTLIQPQPDETRIQD